MRVARLYKFGDIRIEEVPLPEPNEKAALVRVKACGICSGDVMPWYIEKKAPLVLGHEIAGEIVKIGDKIKGEISLKEGDRVVVHHHAPCMECVFCSRGDYVQCETWRSSKIIPGGMAEYILVPYENLKHDTLKIPENVTFEQAVLVEPTACVVKSLKRARIKKGDTLLVIGLGVMGQMHIMLAREFGIKRVIGADLVPFRLERALKAGADYVIDVSKEDLKQKLKEITDGVMPQVVIVGPGSTELISQSLSLVSRGGTVVIFTPTPPNEILHISVNEIYFKDITITTSYSCGPDDTREALSLIEKGILKAELLITHRFCLDEVRKAYEITAEAKNSLKCMVIF